MLRKAAALGRPSLIYQLVTTLHSSNEVESRLDVCRACFLSTLGGHRVERKPNVFPSQVFKDQVAADIVKLLRKFLKSGMVECVYVMLQIALKLGYLSVVRSF